MKHGIQNLEKHNLNDIMQNKYLRDSIERRVNKKLELADLAKSYSNLPSIMRSSIGFESTPMLDSRFN